MHMHAGLQKNSGTRQFPVKLSAFYNLLLHKNLSYHTLAASIIKKQIWYWLRGSNTLQMGRPPTIWASAPCCLCGPSLIR